MKPKGAAIVGGLVAVVVLAIAVRLVVLRIHPPEIDPNDIQEPGPPPDPRNKVDVLLATILITENRDYSRRPAANPAAPYGTIGDLISAGVLPAHRLAPFGAGIYRQEEYLYLILLSPEGKPPKPAWCAIAWPAPSKNPKSATWPAYLVDPEGKLWCSTSLKVAEAWRPELSECFSGEPFASPVRADRWSRCESPNFR